MIYFLAAAALVALDQYTKLAIRSTLELGEQLTLLPGVLGLTYVQNTGMAFSSLSGATWFLTLVSLAASIAVTVMLLRNHPFSHPFGKWTLALILAGAVGNLIDRALFGFVTDMFKTLFMNFAVFNVADICVVCGGIAMIVYVLFFYDKLEGTDGNRPSDC
jgi:signal peptidase II